MILYFAQLRDLKKFRAGRKNAVSFSVACAGSPNEGNRETKEVIYFNKQSLKTADGETIDISQFDSYIVSGNSMLLAGIRDKDIVLTQPLSADTGFPKILVLERDQFAREDAVKKNDYARYKVRRTWRICTMGDDIEHILDEIIHSRQFETLRVSFPDNFLNDIIMKQDFRRRLDTYKYNYPDCESENSENYHVILSTTLHTRHDSDLYNKVTFSIHPIRLVQGEVKHKFHLKKE